MKKKLLLVSFALIATAIIAVTIGPATPKKKDADLKEFLIEAGFRKVPGLISFETSKVKNWWWDKYQVYFISVSEMDSLCIANNFIIGPAERYKEPIPEYAQVEMKRNYDKIEGELLTYHIKNKWSFDRAFSGQFSSKEVGWWMRGKDADDYSNYMFLRRNLKHRLTNRGVKVLKEYYNIDGHSGWDMDRDYSMEKVLVVADISKFDSAGMIVRNNLLVMPPKADPIAVIMHRNGYVIIAKWQ